MAHKPPMTVALDPFKAAEWMGWGHGDFVQAIFTLPAGVSATAVCDVPTDEVWWVTYSIIGEIPNSALSIKVIVSNEIGDEDLSNTVIHEGWIGTPFCPPGWHRCEGPIGVTATYKNITGDATYNDLPAQSVFIHHTFLLFKIKKKFVDQFDEWISALMEGGY